MSVPDFKILAFQLFLFCFLIFLCSGTRALAQEQPSDVLSDREIVAGEAPVSLDLTSLLSESSKASSLQVYVLPLPGSSLPPGFAAHLEGSSLKLSAPADSTGRAQVLISLPSKTGRKLEPLKVTVVPAPFPPVTTVQNKTPVFHWYLTLAGSSAARVESSESIENPTIYDTTPSSIAEENNGKVFQVELGRSFEQWNLFIQLHQTTFADTRYQMLQIGGEWNLAQQFNPAWKFHPYLGVTYGSGTKRWENAPFGTTGSTDTSVARSSVGGAYAGILYPLNERWSLGVRHQVLQMNFVTEVQKTFYRYSHKSSKYQSSLLLLKYQF